MSVSHSGWEVKEKGWETVQIKAFTAWLNGHLEKRGMNIQDIREDLSDGVKLINFLELLSGKSVQTRYDPKPPSRIQKIQNLHIALKFLQKELDVKLVSVGAEDFADQNLKLILGFLWSLFKRYRIQTIKEEDKSSEEGLLLWVKKTTEGYEGVSIESYRHSFRNGLAFAAMCDKFIEDKEVFDYDKMPKDNALELLSNVFETAEKQLDVPKLLDAQEVYEGNIDERSLVLYISLYYHAFVSKEQSEEAEQGRLKMQAQMRNLEENLEEKERSAAEMQQELARLRAELQAEQEAKAELQEKDNYLEEKVSVLKQLLEQESDEKDELEKAKAALEQQLAEREAELAKLRDELAAEKIKTGGLSENKSALLDKVAALQQENTSLINNLEEKKKEADDAAAYNKNQLNGLGVLQTNLQRHVEDLHRWQSFLGFDTETEIDFSGEIRPQILLEITKESFEAQLDSLSKKLEKENSELTNLLKAKEAEAKVKKVQEKKKKDRQKKDSKAQLNN